MRAACVNTLPTSTDAVNSQVSRLIGDEQQVSKTCASRRVALDTPVPVQTYGTTTVPTAVVATTGTATTNRP